VSDQECVKKGLADASPAEIILMLYDGSLKFCEQAKECMGAKGYEGAHNLLVRAQNVVLELLYALDRDKGGEIGDGLASLYTHCYNRLVEANIHRQPEKIDEATSVLKSLRETWREAMKNLPSKKDAELADRLHDELIEECEGSQNMTVRDRTCLRCQHRWTEKIVLSTITSNLSGEKLVCCPKCGTREVVSGPSREDLGKASRA